MRRALSEPSSEEERIATAVVHAAYLVHKALGPGLLESIYEACLCHELSKAGFVCKRQVPVPIVYDGLRFDEGFRLDVLVEDRIVCELKAVDKPHPVHEAQLLSHLKLTSRKLGLLINFNVPLIREGIKRIVLSL
jgi:GxxExxY protein